MNPELMAELADELGMDDVDYRLEFLKKLVGSSRRIGEG
jgi:hypothetical protein